jgi:hypothetical protein
MNARGNVGALLPKVVAKKSDDIIIMTQKEPRFMDHGQLAEDHGV